MSDDIDVSQLLAVIEAQQRSIDHLVELLDKRTAGPATQPSPPQPGPIDWSRISGRERLLAWQGLAGFVEDLVYRYNYQLTIRACWWRHWNVVDELTALWQIKQISFGEGVPLGSAMTWQKAIGDSVDRVRGMLQSCGANHIEVVMPTWMTDQVRHEFYAAVKEDVVANTP